jgi:hypothetical protein
MGGDARKAVEKFRDLIEEAKTEGYDVGLELND